jgi:PAS domain S-box-containing protein
VDRPDPELEQAETEHRLQLLIGSVRDYAIFMLDPSGRVETWNAGAEQIKGYTRAEILGRHIETFYTPEDRLIGKPEALLRIAREAGRVEDEGWRVRKDGTRFWADVVITAVRDEDGELIGYVKVTRDLSDRRSAEEELRQSEQRLRLLIESVKDYAIFMLDPAGHVTTWNVGAERIKGYRADEVIGRHVSLFYPPEERARAEDNHDLEISLRTGRFEVEGWRVRKDGSRFWASVAITPMWDARGRHVGYAEVTRDLTAQRRAEDERVRLAEAQVAIRLRDEFLSIASHELRTPLTALQLQLDALRTRGDHDEKAHARIVRAGRSTERLAELIESLLDVSRIATGRMTFKWTRCDLTAIAREIVDRMEETATRAGCELTLDAPPSLETWCDDLRLAQVLTNLLSNAIKYGAGRPVEVTLARDGDRAVLHVRDHGAGIADEDRARIFERFERAVPLRNFGGLGLGLYVAREVVVAHGGTIAVSDPAGGGACFTVTLPLRDAPPPQSGSRATP